MFHSSRRWATGAALVEFAFILPALLLLLYGIVVYGIVFMTQQAVAYAAERGAEAVVVVNPDLADGPYLTAADNRAREEIQQVLGFLPGGPGDVTVELAAPDSSSLGREVTVRIEYPFSNWGLPAPAFLPLPTDVTGVGVQRVRT